jgi:predicted small secreted protein
MKQGIGFIIVAAILVSCNNAGTKVKPEKNNTPIEGTWKLVSATTIIKQDTTVTDYTGGQEMIKVINGSHFAFLRHDLNQGKDTAIFGAGGGTYTLSGDNYTELLQYCNERGWEGHSFSFTVSIKEDTLLQTGVEKLPKENVDQYIIEKYVRIKNKE